MAGGAGGVEVGRVSIRVVPNTDRFRATLKRKLEEIEKTLKGEVPVEVDLDAGAARAKMAAVMAQLKAMAAKGVTVNVDVDRNLVSRSAIAGLTALSNGFNRASKNAKLFRKTTEFLKSHPDLTWGSLFAIIAAAGPPIIGLVSGVLAGLPSLLGAAAAGAGAVALGLDGIKRAVQPLVPMLNQLKASVSATFETMAAPLVQQIQTLFPVMETGMKQVAAGLTNMAAGFVNAVTSAQGMEHLQNILAWTGAFFSGLSPVIQTGTQSFLTLANAGAQAFEHLLTPLQNFATGFDEMVNRITSNGAFESAMAGMSQVLDSLLNVFTNLMETGVEVMGQFGPQFARGLEGVGNFIVSLTQALAPVSGLIFEVLGALGNALAPAIEALTPGLTEFANLFGTMLRENLASITPLLTQVGELLSGTLATAIQQVAPMMPQLLQSFAQFASTLASELTPHIPELAQALGQMLGTLISLGPTFGQVLTSLIPLIPAFVELGTAGMPLIQAFAQIVSALQPLINLFVQATSAVINFTSGGIIAAISGLAALANAFATVIQKIVEFCGRIISDIPNAFNTALSAIRQFVGEAIAAIVEWVGKVVAEVQGLGSKIRSACANFGSILVDAGKALMEGLLAGIKAGAQAVFDFVSGIAGKIASLKGPIPHDKKVLVPNGEALMEGLQTGLENGFDPVLDKVKALAKELMLAVKEVFGDASGLTINFNVGGAMSGLSDTMSSVASSAADFRSSMAGAAKSANKLDSATKAQLDELQIQKDMLELERQKLQAQKNQLDPKDKVGRQALQQQIDQLNIQKQQLQLQYQQLKYQAQYTDSVGESNEQWGQVLNKAMKMPWDFAKATGDQLLSDFGLGGGALTAALEQGIQFGEQFIFNVGSMDEAIAGQQSIVNKKALQYNQR